jgi:hypothetical protein
LQLRITLSQPTAEVRELVELAAEGIDTDGLSVWVKNCSRAFAGRAYFEAKHCVVRIGGPVHFPIRRHHYPRLKTAPIYDLNSWQEALVLVTAHELRHQQQYRHGWRRSEVDAERWALNRLSAFRLTTAPREVTSREIQPAGSTLDARQFLFPILEAFDGEDRC